MNSALPFQQAHQPERPLPPATSIEQVYDESGQDLLILGEPGAGKSTLLLQLAQRLVERAQQDKEQPLPVVLSLSTWDVKRLSLQSWIIEQLSRTYSGKIGRHLIQYWIQNEELLPLLDGLDELEMADRPACIQAINAYHERALPLVVCSRTAEYDSTAKEQPLALHSAVVVQPLDTEQVDAFLAQQGKPLAALRSALKKKEYRELQQLATTPLWLSVLMRTYFGRSARNLPKMGSLQEQRQAIFANYIDHMLSPEEGRLTRYPPEQMIHGLTFLARQMQPDQTEFAVDSLQPDWLPSQPFRLRYEWSVKLSFMLLAGLSVGLAVGLISGTDAGLFAGLISAFCSWKPGTQSFHLSITEAEVQQWPLTGTWRGRILALVWMPVLGVAFSSLIGLVFWLLLALMNGIGLNAWLFNNVCDGDCVPSIGLWFLIGYVFGTFCGAVFGVLSVPLASLLSWLRSLLLSTQDADKHRASWTELKAKLLWKAMLWGSLGMMFGIVWASSNELKPGLSVWLFIIVCSGLFLGWFLWLRLLPYDKRFFFSPNAGTWQSLWFGLAGGLIVGTVSGLTIGGGVWVIAHGPGQERADFLNIWNAWDVGIFLGTFSGLFVGGDFLRHFILRFWLYRATWLPWNLRAFLNEAYHCGLVYKAERGYCFIHDLFREYLASLGTSNPVSSTP